MADEINEYYLKINFPKFTTSPSHTYKSETGEKEERDMQIDMESDKDKKYGYVQSTGVDPAVIKDIQSRLEKLENFETTMKIVVQELKESIAKLETLRTELEDMRRGYVNVERTLYELAALYDLVSSHLNPFVDSSQEEKGIGIKLSEKMREPEIEIKEETMEYASIYIPKWCKFLLDKLPKDKISPLLEHYMKIGWVDDDIKKRVEDYIEKFGDVSNIKMRKYENMEAEEWWKLSIDDHVQSLQFIEKIREERTKTRIRK